ncbi:MAG: HAMP domain-containing sensor histidine kinase [Nodosilinea sp.]
MPQSSPPLPPLAGWRQMLSEARSRILIWYLLLMSLSSVASVLAVRQILFARLEERVEQSLYQEVEEFRQLRNGRNPETGQPFGDDVEAIFDVFLSRNIPEDDEYLLAIVDGQFYKASSLALPMALRPDSLLMQQWERLSQPVQDSETTLSGTVLYQAEPITRAGEVRGVFVVANAIGRERAEVTESVLIIVQVSLVVLAIASTLAWFAAGKVLAPLRLLSQTARLITETNLTERIPLDGTTGDIAELTRTFNDMLDRIEATFNSQRQLLNDVGHELRTPITIVRGHLELMGTTPQEQQETLDIVIDELDRMSRFIDELMLLAKAERPDFLFPEPIDLTVFTEEVYAKITALGDRQWQLEAVADGHLLGDRQRLTEAIVNLAQNSTQHTGLGDTIALGSSRRYDQVHIWVRDTGEGIELSDQTRIFQRFVRGKSRYGRSDGSGLGLAIVQAIVQAHGGTIQLVSQPDSGATFTLVLPLNPFQDPHP